MSVHTHYDNLKVARDASPELIRAAYIVHADKYSPSRQPGSTEAARILLLVNTAYEILSDSERRKRHDLWIQEQERGNAPDAEFGWWAGTEPPSSPSRWRVRLVSKLGGVSAHFRRRWSLYVLVAIAVGVWATYKPEATQPETSKPYLPELAVAPSAASSNSPLAEHTHKKQSNPAPAQASYVRPTHAPDGASWPRAAGYVDGYKSLRTNGLSTVTIDNRQNHFDIFVKLVSLGGKVDRSVRAFFIPAEKIFTIRHIKVGSYDIRYEDLSTGSLWRTDKFDLKEISLDDGIQYSDVTMTLYKVPYGNMQTYPISASQF